MGAEVLLADELPNSAVEAAADFHQRFLPKATVALGADQVDLLVICFATAGHEHTDWRRAITRDLARENAPKRVNSIAADSESAAEAMLAYLRDAPGVTGQYLPAHE